MRASGIISLKPKSLGEITTLSYQIDQSLSKPVGSPKFYRKEAKSV